MKPLTALSGAQVAWWQRNCTFCQDDMVKHTFDGMVKHTFDAKTREGRTARVCIMHIAYYPLLLVTRGRFETPAAVQTCN